ncbi:MAG: DUF2190 family protein [Xanthomonadales bacterium]|nr:DUF2190 family protein [Xanthomonadales bacterium]
MATNAIQDGRVLDHTLSADCASGDVIVKGALVGVAITGGKSGATIALQVTGVWSVPKLSTAVITDGASLTWDISAGKVIIASPATGDIEGFGVATAAAASGTTSVDVLLTPGTGAAKSA